MTKNVLVSIAGFHEADGETGGIQTAYPGQYSFVNNKHMIRYVEPEEGQEDCSHGTPCLLKVAADSVTLTKRSVPRTEMFFCLGRQCVTMYRTPMGTIPMEILTKTLTIAESEQELRIQLTYQLIMNEAPLGDSELSIVITPA
jgi:uncharacterized beta-barrel protein YwiB (DUF1934 family)